MKNKLALAVGAVLLCTAAQAGNWNAGARISTLGLAAEGGYQFNETFGLRLQATWWEHFKKTLSYDNVKYHNVRFRPITINAYADWYFYTTWWRLSGGLGYNGTRIRLNRDFSNHPKPERAATGIVSAKYRFKNPLKYYVGSGIDIRKIGGTNWTFSMDAGVYFMGKVKAKVQMTGPAKESPQARAVAKREAEELLNDKKWFSTYPAISIGFKYEF
jgi:opacity protein-like surface antigen